MDGWMDGWMDGPLHSSKGIVKQDGWVGGKGG